MAASAAELLVSASTGAARSFKVAIIGGSIGGLAAATAFHRVGAQVKVFEKSPTPFDGRGGSIGFCHVDLWEHLAARRMIRRGRQASRAQGAFLYGDLWRYWFAGLPKECVAFGAHVSDLGDDEMHPTINGEVFDVAIIADGGWSALRTRYFGSALPQYAGYQVWRFRVEASLVPEFSAYGEYRAGHHATILLPVAMDDGRDFIMGGSAVPQPESEVIPPPLGFNRQAGSDGADEPSLPEWFLPFYKDKFGAMAGGELYRAMAAAAVRGKIAVNPLYEFAASRIVRGRLVLVGDAAHMASPRTAAGAHTAVLDALGLLEAFASTAGAAAAGGGGAIGAAIDAALAAYEPPALRRARELYARSLVVSAEVMPPGWKRDATRK